MYFVLWMSGKGKVIEVTHVRVDTVVLRDAEIRSDIISDKEVPQSDSINYSMPRECSHQGIVLNTVTNNTCVTR